MTHTINNEQYYTIQEFCNLVHMSQPAIRHLITEGNKIRKMQSYREGVKLYIKATELEKFPFTERGYNAFMGFIYHYRKNDKGQYERYICTYCTEGRTYDHDINVHRAGGDLE